MAHATVAPTVACAMLPLDLWVQNTAQGGCSPDANNDPHGLARSQSMRMCPHPNIAFSSARIRCDAADRGSRVRHHPPASGAHPAREKHVLTDQKRRRKGEDPLRRRHTEGQQQSKDRATTLTAIWKCTHGLQPISHFSLNFFPWLPLPFFSFSSSPQPYKHAVYSAMYSVQSD